MGSKNAIEENTEEHKYGDIDDGDKVTLIKKNGDELTIMWFKMKQK